MLFSVQQHIASLFSFFSGKTIELQPRGKYQVSLFVSRANLSCSVVVTLPPNFPSYPPVFSVEPPMAHPWIDSKMDIYGHPSLVSWNATVLIGKILKDIELEFGLRPPHAINISANIPRDAGVLPVAQQNYEPRKPATPEDSKISFPEIETKTYGILSFTEYPYIHVVFPN